jgi:hypothetical protein
MVRNVFGVPKERTEAHPPVPETEDVDELDDDGKKALPDDCQR